jgi:hypothetical protein
MSMRSCCAGRGTRAVSLRDGQAGSDEIEPGVLTATRGLDYGKSDVSDCVRSNLAVIARSKATKQSTIHAHKVGLLRCARNDEAGQGYCMWRKRPANETRDGHNRRGARMVEPLVAAGFKPALFRQSRLARYSRNGWSFGPVDLAMTTARGFGNADLAYAVSSHHQVSILLAARFGEIARDRLSKLHSDDGAAA